MQTHRDVLTPDALGLLQAVARTGSFAAAARELGLVPSAVTYRVRQSVAPRADRGAAEREEMHDSSTWVRSGSGWKCVIHTETPVATEAAH